MVPVADGSAQHGIAGLGFLIRSASSIERRVATPERRRSPRCRRAPGSSTKREDAAVVPGCRLSRPAMVAGASRTERYIFPVGMGMSELKMSQWIFHVPFDFFETLIHLPWSIWEPSAPVISYVPVP